MTLSNREQGVLVLGLGVGAAVVAATPHVAAVLGPVLRPLARSALKHGILLYERGRELSARFAEDLEDIVAEVKADLRPRAAAEPGAPPAPEGGDAAP